MSVRGAARTSLNCTSGSKERLPPPRTPMSGPRLRTVASAERGDISKPPSGFAKSFPGTDRPAAAVVPFQGRRVSGARPSVPAGATRTKTLPWAFTESIKDALELIRPGISSEIPQPLGEPKTQRGNIIPLSGTRTCPDDNLTFVRTETEAAEIPLLSSGRSTFDDEDFCRPRGSAVLLECRGGPHQGADGWRKDTIPICKALTEAGLTTQPMFYSDAEFEEVQAACAEADAIIVRINPMRYEGVTQSLLDELLREMSDMGKAVMSHPDVMAKMGAKDALVKIRDLSCGMTDTYAYYDIPTFKANFPTTVASGTRVLKQNRGSQGDGIWVCKVKAGQSGPVTGETVLEVQEALDNHREEQTVDDFMKFCEKYIVGENGQLIDQRFLPRIAEGELRVNMIYDTPVEIVHKKPVDGGISATLASGAKYVSYKPDDPQFAVLMDNFINKDLSKIMEALDMEGEPLPLIWTSDFILGEKVDGKDTYFIGEFNCSCVGITQQLHLCPLVAEAALKVAAQCECCRA